MFEDSTFESRGVIRTRSRGWMLATFALNGSVLLALVLIPLIYPEALPSLTTTILMTVPAPPAEEPKPRPMPAHAAVTQTLFSQNNIQAPSIIPKNFPTNDGPDVSANIDIAGLDSNGSGTASADSPWNEHPQIVVVQQPKTTARVSQGVMNGLLLQKIPPVYPPIARAIRAEGTVVLQATISRNGTIENLRVVSGPPLLQQAAVDAVRQWRYRPYLLNGAPIEVETTVNVVFTMN